MSGRTNPKLRILADDVVVVRAAEVAAFINDGGHTLREAGAHYGITASSLWRQLRVSGYRDVRYHQTKWEKVDHLPAETKEGK